MDNKEQQFEKRLQNFSLEVIGLCKKIKEDTISRPIISQIIRSATSIGANYSEANNASSRSDFRNKIFICKKETQETKYWLKLTDSVSDDSVKIDELWRECHEFSLIFQKIISTMAANK
jgi:four helix bundle protein